MCCSSRLDARHEWKRRAGRRQLAGEGSSSEWPPGTLLFFKDQRSLFLTLTRCTFLQSLSMNHRSAAWTASCSCQCQAQRRAVAAAAAEQQAGGRGGLRGTSGAANTASVRGNAGDPIQVNACEKAEAAVDRNSWGGAGTASRKNGESLKRLARNHWTNSKLARAAVLRPARSSRITELHVRAAALRKVHRSRTKKKESKNE